MLSAKNITKQFSGVTALDNVSLNLQTGKVNAIIGENGAGKSTLMKILSGVYTDYEGTIELDNQPVKFKGEAGCSRRTSPSQGRRLQCGERAFCGYS